MTHQLHKTVGVISGLVMIGVLGYFGGIAVKDLLILLLGILAGWLALWTFVTSTGSQYDLKLGSLRRPNKEKEEAVHG